MFELSVNDRTAWVTGGSRGIGKATAIALAKAGCDVAVGYCGNKAKAEETVKEIEAMGKKAIAVQIDVKQKASCEKAYGEICEKLAKVDVIVNSAGVIRDNLFVMLEEEDWREVIDTNLIGGVNVIKTVLRDMMMSRWGRIINLSSVAGTKGGRGQANYSASKGAVEAMTRSLATELGKRNITVNCLAPGVIETDMSAEVRKLGESEILARQVVKRFGAPEEIAAWAVMLASDFGGFVTGQTLHIDGGIKMI